MSWGQGHVDNSIGWGQGDNNDINWGEIYGSSASGDTALSGVYTDPDAQAFITAASITDPTQQSAVNQLVVDLKTASIWTKFYALYPFVGGSATTHKWNLKDPRDLDAAFRLSFIGGLTHSANGIDPNGTNGYADTFINPSTHMVSTSGSMWYYSRENIQTNVLMGTTSNMWFAPQLSNGFRYNACNSGLTNDNTNFPSSYAGLLGISRTNSTNKYMYRNGVSYVTDAVGSEILETIVKIHLFQRSGIGQNTANQCAFAAIGDGLTSGEAASLYTAVQTFQTTLNRNV